MDGSMGSQTEHTQNQTRDIFRPKWWYLVFHSSVIDIRSIASGRIEGSSLKLTLPRPPKSITKITHFIFKIFSHVLLSTSTTPSPLQAPVIAHLEHPEISDLHWWILASAVVQPLHFPKQSDYVPTSPIHTEDPSRANQRCCVPWLRKSPKGIWGLYSCSLHFALREAGLPILNCVLNLSPATLRTLECPIEHSWPRVKTSHKQETHICY